MTEVVQQRIAIAIRQGATSDGASEVLRVLARVELPPGIRGLACPALYHSGTYHGVGLQLFHYVPDRDQPEERISVMSHAVIDGALPREDYVLAQVRSLLYELVTHEVNEWLKLDGRRYFDPHPEYS